MSTTYKKGKVILVGAGCGDVELITRKGMKEIERADTVIYDSLASKELLSFCTEGCETIYVGKRYAKHSATQEEINELLIEKATEGKRVVRLKGGDPFVFGRGGEEILALQKEEISYEVIPGISSAIAVPSAAGIPVTHRELSRSFHVITGHTSDGLDIDFEKLACLEGTLVFLMGLHHLEEISAKLIKNGKDKQTPAAVIVNGTLEHQKCVRAPLFEIAKKAQENKLESPGVIVIGEVAALDLLSADIEKKIFASVVGTESFTQKMKSELEKEDIVCKTYPYCKLVDRSEGLREVNFSRYSVLCFTSSNGVEVFFHALKKAKIDLRNLGKMKIAAIGSGTAETLSRYGFFADFLPGDYTAEGMAEGLVKWIKPEEEILIARAERGSEALTDILRENNVNFSEYKIYDLTMDEPLVKAAVKEADEADFLIFASASGAEGYFLGGGKISHSKIVCIGKATEKAIKSYTDREVICAKQHTAEGIVTAIKESLA